MNNISRIPSVFRIIILTLIITGCSMNEVDSSKQANIAKVILTSSAGAKQEQMPSLEFNIGKANGLVIEVYPDMKKQAIVGIGSSFTESSAFVLAHLSENDRKEVMENIYGEKGANFSLARTHIGSCDFTVQGKYSYNDLADDINLSNFSIMNDLKGFDKQQYPDLVKTSYDLLPMIMEAYQVKSQQKDKTLNIVASAWTAPAWMKDIETWYIPGAPENNWQGTGGSLKAEYEEVYADYLIKYLQAYQMVGIDIWGITPVNEPHGNNGQWESMKFTPESQNSFIKRYLGPKLQENKFKDVKLLIYDQNRDGLEEWVEPIYNDTLSSEYVYGAAIHWYESTNKVYEDVLRRVHSKYPNFDIMHTEGCIDDLGKDAPGGVTDTVRFKEKDWFNNDDFWWNPNATDWAYSVTWQGVKVEDHPIYTPVHRYARNIILSLDNWVSGWIDWNVVLDSKGGPNHVGNFCGAPIMIDRQTKDVYYTPIYHILSQFSRTIRPGDYVITNKVVNSTLDDDDLHVLATINSAKEISIQMLNTSDEIISTSIQIEDSYIQVEIPANSLETLQMKY